MNDSKNHARPPESQPGGDGKLLFNRELSWLEFNRRVLENAFDENLPLLERLKFLAIFSTNLDEFFMIRVSGLKEQVEDGVRTLSPDGMTPVEQLAELDRRLRPMLGKQSACLHKTILPALAENGITIEPYKDLSRSEKKRLDEYFFDDLFPILTPQAVDASHKFPYISNTSLNLGLFIEPDKELIRDNLKPLFRRKRFARITSTCATTNPAICCRPSNTSCTGGVSGSPCVWKFRARCPIKC
jgi:polyphosphate kinase